MIFAAAEPAYSAGSGGNCKKSECKGASADEETKEQRISSSRERTRQAPIGSRRPPGTRGPGTETKNWTAPISRPHEISQTKKRGGRSSASELEPSRGGPVRPAFWECHSPPRRLSSPCRASAFFSSTFSPSRKLVKRTGVMAEVALFRRTSRSTSINFCPGLT